MATIGNLIVNIGAKIDGLRKGLKDSEGLIQGAKAKFDGLGKAVGTGLKVAAGLGVAGLLTFGAGAVSAAGSGLAFNNSLEQTTAKINAFTKDGAKTAEILTMIKTRAASTPFEFEQMANAASALLPSARQAGVGLEELIAQAEILAASNPAEGLEGAAFALKEAVSGDFTSIIERFNLPRQYINQLKEQGVPALEAVGMAMQQMGLDASLVTNLAETASGRWSTLKDTFTNLAATVTQPIFEAVSSGLGTLNGYLAENEPLLTKMAEGLAGKIKTGIDWFVSTGIPNLTAAYGWVTGTAIPTLQQWGQAYVMPALNWLVNTGLPTMWQTGQQVWGWITGTAIPTLQLWGQTVGDFVTPKFEVLRALFDKFVTLVLPPLQEAWRTLVTVWQTEVGPALDELWAALGELFDELGLGTGDTDLWSVALGALKLILAGVVLGVKGLTPIIRALADGLVFGINQVKRMVEGLTSMKRGAEALLQPLQNVADKIQAMIDKALAMPGWLIPHSPTPFEKGLRGIGAAMKELPELKLEVRGQGAGLALAGAPAGGGSTFGPINIYANSRKEGQEAGEGFMDALRSKGLR